MKLERRRFLKAVSAVAGTGWLLPACGDEEPAGSGSDAGVGFPSSVASGDPRPHSVVLWTRVEHPDMGDGDIDVLLEVASHADFTKVLLLDGKASLSLTAEEAFDHTVRVKVEDLDSATTYYYRFSYSIGGETFVSRVGRTKTAPKESADAKLRFAVISCQDYSGKYYHVLRHLVTQELDFVVHLGDYVYETTGDPSFQDPTSEREVRFRRHQDALELGDEGRRYFAARSLGNYRDLYRTYRSDRDLQRLHELFPIIAVWDDHEFSNDCHGQTSTYLNGAESEEDPERRRAADQAWFEYMPVDYSEGPPSTFDPKQDFPADLRIYRSFLFGENLELVMTDLRRYRPDHVVPEDAFPGAVFATQAELEALEGSVPADAAAYVDIESYAEGLYQERLVEAASELEFSAAKFKGLISAPWINSLLETLNETAADETPLIDLADPTLERGYAYHQLLKNAEFGANGARYLLKKPPFMALANKRYAETDGASEDLLGEAQREWFTETLQASTRTWKVWGSQFALMPRTLDLTGLAVLPPEFQGELLLSADDWDGAPNGRSALLGALGGVDNVVVLAGDLHAFFAGIPEQNGAPETRVVEFIVGSVSSTTWQTGIRRAIESDPTIPTQAALLASAVDSFLTDKERRPNPHLGYLDLERNGYATVSVDAKTLGVRFYAIKDTDLLARELEGSLEDHFESIEFRVPSRSRALEQKIDGKFKRWDPQAMEWV